MKKDVKYFVSIPDGPIEHMKDSWADNWINIWSDGSIGYCAGHRPTEAEKKDIKKLIIKLKELLNKRIESLNIAWILMR